MQRTQTSMVPPHIDVLLCVGATDVDRLWDFSLTSCLNFFAPCGSVTVVTPDPRIVAKRIQSGPLSSYTSRIQVLADEEILPPSAARLNGWIRQQLIKLQAHTLTRGSTIACMGADTVFLKASTQDDWLVDGKPILYHAFRFPPDRHLEYERVRLINVSRLLGSTAPRASRYIDFIMDFMVFETAKLRQLGEFMAARHGMEWWSKVLPSGQLDLQKKSEFGEQTLYATYLLDVLAEVVPMRELHTGFLTQVHGRRDIAAFRFDSVLAHFVSKEFDLAYLRENIRHCWRSNQSRARDPALL